MVWLLIQYHNSKSCEINRLKIALLLVTFNWSRYDASGMHVIFQIKDIKMKNISPQTLNLIALSKKSF